MADFCAVLAWRDLVDCGSVFIFPHFSLVLEKRRKEMSDNSNLGKVLQRNDDP